MSDIDRYDTVAAIAIPSCMQPPSHRGVFSWLEQLRGGQILEEGQVLQLCNRAKEIFIEEANVQRVDTPVTVR